MGVKKIILERVHLLSSILLNWEEKATKINAQVFFMGTNYFPNFSSTRWAGQIQDLVQFDLAVKHGKLKLNPIANVKRLPENNVRQRILTLDEFTTLLNACDPHLKRIVQMAYHMGMRKDEIVRLTWPEVDLKKGFIRLPAERTKTDSPRTIPLHPDVRATLEKLPRGLHTDRVFLRHGQPFDEIKHSFQSACEKAKIENFCFHDLRHCALNNLRKAGNDFFQIMALSGHRTISVFKRYNLVTEEELSQIKWHT
jgi:integrase